MRKSLIIQKLIDRTKDDFLSYFVSPPLSDKAESVIQNALSLQGVPVEMTDEIESMIPDTEEDGRWECSYALNTGLMILCLIDYMRVGDEKYYNDTVELFFDSVDFKVQQDLERIGTLRPTEDQICKHNLYMKEKDWFDCLVVGVG